MSPPEIPITLNSSSRRASRQLLDVGDRFEGTLPRDELRPADARPVGAMSRKPARFACIGDVRRLVVRADQPVEEEGGMAPAVAILVDLERLPGFT